MLIFSTTATVVPALKRVIGVGMIMIEQCSSKHTAILVKYIHSSNQ